MDKSDHDMLIEIHTCICGTNGQGGLLKSHERLKKDFYDFRRLILIILAFLVGSGLLGIGIFELIKKSGG